MSLFSTVSKYEAKEKELRGERAAQVSLSRSTCQTSRRDQNTMLGLKATMVSTMSKQLWKALSHIRWRCDLDSHH